MTTPVPATPRPFAPPLPPRPLPIVTGRGPDGRLALATPGSALGLADAERARLDRRADRAVERAERAGAPITYLGFTRPVDEPRLYPGEQIDWVLMQMQDDPLARDGRFPIPKAQRQQLSRLVQAGVEMDGLLVAHELPAAAVRSAVPAIARTGPQVLPREVLGRLIEHPGSAESTRRFTDRAGRLAEGAGAITRKVGRGAGKVAKGAAIATAAIAAAPFLVAGDLLDPVIFGVREVREHPDVVQLFELVRWEW